MTWYQILAVWLLADHSINGVMRIAAKDYPSRTDILGFATCVTITLITFTGAQW